MALLGFLILVFVALTVLVAVFRGGDTVRIDVNAFTIESTVGQVFAAGALTLLLLAVGVWMMRTGLRRSRARRAEVQGLKKRAAAGDQAVKREQSRAQTESGSADESTGSGPGKRSADGPDSAFDSSPRER